MICLAEQLDINCIVEGVATAEQLAALPTYPRLLVQGHYYAKPEPSTEPLKPQTQPQCS